MDGNMVYKILMTAMSLDIGGAETHILELAKELKQRGHDVTVVSNGGVYTAELAENGIEHVTLPLHNKKIRSVIKSYFGLKKIIKSGGFDVVHAHARIPAFICGLLEKRLHFRFVTTAHLTFNINFLWKRITNWGEKSLAVSEDIKDYLIKNYNLYPDNISVTINGIDRKKFSSTVEYGDIVDEFGLDKSKRRIVYVSRIDSDRSAVAFMLVEIAERLYNYNNNVEITIVGGGSDYNRLRAAVEKANSKIGFEVIKLTGARADINKFIAYSEIVVAVSRSALEAMSAEKTVIIAGNEGYLGLFEPEMTNIAVMTNFCCRGCENSEPNKLYKDIVRALELSPAEKAAHGRYNSELIDRYYSVRQMADDAEKMYSSVMYPHGYRTSDVVISGYYGFGNLGDDSLLQMIIKNLREKKPDIKITVLSKKPAVTSRTYGVKSVGRINYPAVNREIKRSRLLINGGGSLLQNTTSMRSLIYYISIMKLAVKKNVKMMLYASGIGPLYGEKSRKMVRDILEKTDVISLREDISKRDLRDIGVKNANVYVSSDPAFCIEAADDERIAYILNREKIKIGDNAKIFIVSLREWNRSAPDFEEKMAELCAYIMEKYGIMPLFVVMQEEKDRGICIRIRNEIKSRCECIGVEINEIRIIGNLSASELVGLFSRAEFVIGMRLHALIYAAVAAVPVIGLNYDPKITSVMAMLEQNRIIDVNAPDEIKMRRYTDEMIMDRENISAAIAKRASELKHCCEIDAENAVNLLK